MTLGFGLVERAQHRLRERVADDRHLGDPALLHHAPELVRVEVAGLERHDRAADRHGLERGEGAGAVHERRRREVHGDPARVDDPLRDRAGGFGAADHRLAVEGIHALEQHADEVFVAPHHTLGHARGPAGVEEVVVVAAAGDPLHRRVGGEQRLVLDRALDERRAVVDLHEQLQLRCPARDLGDELAEAAVEQERLGVGVVEEVDELFFQIPVVDVDGDPAQLERAEQSLDVLVGVVEVRRDLRIGAETRRAQPGREPRRAVVELAPRARPLTLDQRGPIGSASATDS